MSDLPLEISCHEVHARRTAGEPLLLLDCREEAEHALVAITGNRLLPMSQLTLRVAELAGQENEKIVVYCHHGGRSAQVTMWLRQQGFLQTQSMAGGIDRWALEIDPGMVRYE